MGDVVAVVVAVVVAIVVDGIDFRWRHDQSHVFRARIILHQKLAGSTDPIVECDSKYVSRKKEEKLGKYFHFPPSFKEFLCVTNREFFLEVLSEE